MLYVPKIWASVFYLILNLGALILYLSKKRDNTIFTNIYSEFNLHVSNFSLSIMLGLIGYFLFYSRKNFDSFVGTCPY